MRKLRDIGYKLLAYPPNCPVSLRLPFLPKTQTQYSILCDQYFSDQWVIVSVEGHFAHIIENNFRYGVVAMEHQRNKYIIIKKDLKIKIY